ncbi:MAG: hypothetical protein ACP5PX_06775 [Candidatus Hadarchaeum sp.]|uniref:hypothetical protein n=1 Tax=Candidatus Hadarchaeum sp. TaxID=2883567 RepID=UPI003D15238D
MGLVILIVGKLVEASLNFPGVSWDWMYVSDPLMMAGALLLFSRLGGEVIGKSEGPDRKMVGGLFLGVSLLVIVMFALSYIITGANDWRYSLVSIVYYTGFLAIGMSYLELGGYHPLAFLAAFFVVSNIVVCLGFDAGFWAGTITEEAYSAAPWWYSYAAQTLAGIFAVLPMVAKGSIKKVQLAKLKTTKNETWLAAGILIFTIVVIFLMLYA